MTAKLISVHTKSFSLSWLKNLLHLNVAACYLKLGECRKSIETCNKVCFMA